jgi:predicted metal-dependent hydrolase
MVTQLKLGDIAVDVVLKDIKNVHLSVYPPTGRIRISAPKRLSLNTIRVFAISKLGWIKQQQKKLREQERETPREYLNRESHYVWGKRYLLKIIEERSAPRIELKHNKMVLWARPGVNDEAKRAIVARWYREQIKAVVPGIIAKWEPLVGVKVKRIFVQEMKTKWGSCNQRERSIRLNTDLAKKPRECLEYIVVHEMVHVLEPTHNARFIALMDRLMPQWRVRRQELNRTPLSHEKWTY